MKVTLEPPSEEEDDTVVESTESDSDPADQLFKQQHFDDQRNLVRRRSTVVLNQNSLDDVKIGREEAGPKLPEKRKTPEQKCEKMEEAEENNFKTSSSGERRRPVENGGEDWRKDNCDNCAAKRILEELENIKRRISQIEHDVKIGLL